MDDGRHIPIPTPHPPPRAFLAWLAVCLVVFAALPGMISGNYLPKIFWAAAAGAAGLALLPPRRRNLFALSPLGAVWAAYLGWALLSLAWAPQPRVGFERWLVMLLLTMAYLLAGRTRFWESGSFWTAFSCIVGLASIIGILQYYAPWFTPVNYFPGTAIPRGTMGHRNYAGMYLMVTLPFLAWSYFSARGRKVFIYFVALLLGTGFLLLVKTRGAWVGLGAGTVFFFAAGGLKKIIRRPGRAIPLAGAVLATAGLAVLVNPPAPVARAMAGKADVVGTARTLLDASNRLELWRGLPGMTDPLLGAGFGNFPIIASAADRLGAVKTLNWEVHNDYLQAYLDLGIPGAILFAAFFFILLRLAWKGRKEGILLAAGAAVTGLAVMQFTVFTMEVVSSQVWMAGVAALINRAAGGELKKFAIPPRTARTANYLAVLGLLALAGIVGFTIGGDREFRRTRREIERLLEDREILRHRERHPPEEVWRARNRLRASEPRLQERLTWLTESLLPTMLFDSNMRHVNSHQFSTLSMHMQNFEAVKAFSRWALRFHPHDRICLGYLAMIALREEQTEAAFEYLNRGVEIFGYNPYLPFFAVNLARIHRERGETSRAREILERMETGRVSAPSSPSPPSGASRVPTGITLEWEECRAAVSYDVYLWTRGEKVESPVPVARGITANRFRPRGGLKPGVTYIWRVRAVGRYGEETGRLWFFRTAEEAE